MEQVPRLLLVNAVQDDRAELRAVLESLRLQIVEAASGLEAVDELQRNQFDLVVTAIEIGEFDSWKLARFIRSGICRGGRSIPIIIVTRDWCERITEITARDFGINQLLTFGDRKRLPELVEGCLAKSADVLGKLRILVVEDHQDNAQLIEKILSSRFDVELTANGEEGLAAWKARRHDLVLLDVMLPLMSGGDVLKNIMAIDPSQPVVMVTAHGTMDVAKKMMLDGAADFVTKPFRVEELRRVCELATRREDYLVSNAQMIERLEDLQQLKGLLGNIVDSMPSLLIGVDLLGRINLWNRRAETVSGVMADDAHGRLLQDIWPEFNFIPEVEAALQQGEMYSLDRVEQCLLGKNSFCDITIYPLCEATVVGAVIRIDDVSSRVQLEERIIQTEKMASMGQLAAGMAHEINNPLAGVMQNVQVVKNRLSPSLKANRDAAEEAGFEIEELEDYLQIREIPARLDAIMDAGRRTVELIDNMVSFSRQDNESLSDALVSELIDKSVDLAAGNFDLKRKFDFRSIEIIREYDSAVETIECNAMQIQQVIFNLLLNGAHAMEKKVTQHRSVGGADYRPCFVLRTSNQLRKIRIEVEDNGIGMDEVMQQKLFEPFNTIRSIGNGTGLGMSICYFIITENHGGSMSVESRPNVGTRFILELPKKFQ
ncbi:PAS domain S-box-containing protein [Malonomonas rubra DSM 5091]|uniref:histidine kinase n=1 Tax=Malonomonas rubra DSM 5091 TaxID=1122189 RepID=A0A1M6BHR1_MALRU|nr:response regulator [Malonomonas rubra]SHI48272.1 PAS domain S-box-containing protein [Malonomonas rubra DSM 5091]